MNSKNIILTAFALLFFVHFINMNNLYSLNYLQNENELLLNEEDSTDSAVQTGNLEDENVTVIDDVAGSSKDTSATVLPVSKNKTLSMNTISSPFYSKWWFTLIIVFILAPFLVKRRDQVKNQKYNNKVNDKENEIIALMRQLSDKTNELEQVKKDYTEGSSAEKELRYQSDGISLFSDILSKNKNNTSVLTQKIVSELVQYLQANSGAIYIVKDNNESDDVHLDFLGGYAPSSEQIKASFKPGEGYVGTCFEEGKTMEMDNTTDSYIKVTSGLGESKPAYLIFVPLIQDELKLGVIELASFNRLESYKVKFVEKLAENIANTLALNQANEKTSLMLEQSTAYADELRAQEEELRQNLEEMHATQEELHKQKEELAKEKSLMDAFLTYSKESIYFKDIESKFIKTSHSMAKLFKVKNVEEIYGKSDFDFFTEEHARPAFEDEMNIIKTGVPIIDKVEMETHADGRITYVTTSKMPLRDNKGNIIGTFGISKDITELKQIEMRMKEQNEELLSQEEELRQNLEEMQTTQEELQRQAAENKKVQEELAREKYLMDALMNNIPDHIYFKDTKGHFLKTSQSMVKLFGVESFDEIYGKSDFDFFDEDHARPAYEDEQKIIKTGKPIIDLIEKEVQKDGKVGWVSTSKLPLRDKEGKIIGTFGISRDITDRMNMEMDIKQKNEELQAQEEELRQNLEEMLTTQEELSRQIKENKKVQAELEKENYLLDALMQNSPDRIYFKDAESRFIRNSQSLSRLFGFDDINALIGKSDFDFFDELHARPAYEDEQKIIKTGKPIIDLVEKEVQKDGKVGWVSTSKLPLRNKEGKIIGTFGISRDITDRMNMEMDIKQKNEELQAQEEELRQNLEEMLTTQEELNRQIEETKRVQVELEKENYLLDTLLSNVPERIYFKDNESKFIRNSLSLSKLFGFSDINALIGKSDFDFFDEQHARPAYENEQKIMKTGKPIVDLIEKEIKKDGTTSWVNTCKMPLKDQKGKIVGTFGISMDITKRVTLEMALKQKNEELEAQDEEFRQSLEEMHAIQDDMNDKLEKNRKMIEEYESKEKELKQKIQNLENELTVAKKRKR